MDWPKTIGMDGRRLTDELGSKVQLVGDDIFVTNISYFQRGIDSGRGEFNPHQAEPDWDGKRDDRRD